MRNLTAFLRQSARWARNHAITILGIAFLGISIFSFALSYRPGWLIADYGANFTTEILSVAITIVVIDRLYAMRQRQELRASLTRDLKSKSPSHAVRAVEELRHHGWLNDVLQEQKNGGLYMVVLEGADLRLVDLSDADLRGANLRRVNMFGSHLENADVRGANLQKAWLVNASLRGARLCYGHLEGAFLQDANLEGADLKDAKFEGATLPHAKLNGAINITEEQLLSVKLIGGATMPDGIMLSEGDLLVGVRQGIEGPSLEEWLARQRSLPANQRAIELSAIADVAPRLRKGSLGSREVFRVFARTVSSIFRRVLR